MTSHRSRPMQCHFTGGGGGGLLGSWMQDERSKKRNSSAFSASLSGLVVQPKGNDSPPLPVTCTSLKTTRPHWFFGSAPTGVLKLRYFAVSFWSLRSAT